MKSQSIGVIGAGAWGTAISIHLARNGLPVDLWVYESEVCEEILTKRENSVYLPNFELPSTIFPSTSLEYVVKDKDSLFLVVPSHVMRLTAKHLDPFLKPGCLIINATKGIENDSLQTVNTILQKTISASSRLASISGPTFATEVAKQVPSAIVAAAKDMKTAEDVQTILSTSHFKVFTSTDILGVELGGSLKNVIAIATGIADGLELGFNARSALITRGLVEMKRIGTALGARPETFSGLSGMGDLVLTCTGDLSRNRSVGVKLGRGEKLKEIVESMQMVAEGVKTVKSAYSLKKKLNTQASIIEETYNVLYEEKPPLQALEDLMKVETASEFIGVKGLK